MVVWSRSVGLIFGAAIILSSQSWSQEVQHRPNPTEEISEWCSDIKSTIQEDLDRSLVLRYQGQNAEAQALLLSGLENLSNRPIRGRSEELFTQKAIQRGVEIAQAIQVVLGNPSSSVLHFLNRYDQYLLRLAEVDGRRYYYRRSQDFEDSYLEYAAKQANVPLLVFTQIVGNQVFPVGDTRAFFKAVQLSAKYLEDDLVNSPWLYRYACQIKALRLLQAGQTIGSLSEVQAFRETYRKYLGIVQNLNRYGSNCSPYR